MKIQTCLTWLWKIFAFWTISKLQAELHIYHEIFLHVIPGEITWQIKDIRYHHNTYCHQICQRGNLLRETAILKDTLKAFNDFKSEQKSV